MAVSDWDAYWRNAGSAAAHKEGGPQDEALEHFWIELFARILPELNTGSRILDIACGNGAVIRFALTALGNKGDNFSMHVYGLDRSPAALREMRKRTPGLFGIAANSTLLPFPDDVFDIVTSQFGVEYGGTQAMLEASRVVVPGGTFAAVLHLRDGAIYRECASNLDAISGIRNSNILPRFRSLFQTAREVQEGLSPKQQFLTADKDFAAAVAATEEVLKRWGKGVADGMLYRLYRDIAHMYRRFRHYEPGEVFNWIDLMSDELETFAGRMAAMLQSALNPQQLDQLIGQLTAERFSLHRHEMLKIGRLSVPAAWVVIAQKSNK